MIFFRYIIAGVDPTFKDFDDYDDEYDDDYEDDFDQPTKDENIDMKPFDGWEQTADGFVKPPEEETSPALPEAPETIESPALQERIQSYYKFLEDNGYRVNKSTLLEHKATFTLSPSKKLSVNYRG